jgi:microcin C transport system substrate-binding protein
MVHGLDFFRNFWIVLIVTLLPASIITVDANAQTSGEWRHGHTLFGQLKYPAGFTHFDHVNPQAPKGGRFNSAASGGFDSFNPFVVRGRPAAGLNYAGGVLYDTLFEQSVDQASASYGLVAEAFKYPEDFSSATYRLNPNAKWHDGQPITPEDVIWSLAKLREIQPLYSNYYKNIVSAEKTGDLEITFTFDMAGNRELPAIMGDLPVLPKHWWEANGPDGKPRNIGEPIVEAPLGSGPYRIKSFKLGESVTWERVEDYWAAEIGVRKGRFNYDELRYVYFGDDNAIWEGFKKGGIEDLRREFRSQRWATEYNFPAYEKGDVVRNAFPTESSETYQAFFFNTRNPKFSDVRLREALAILFDFESMNKNLFFGLYKRTTSYFEGGELKASGLPEGRELEILEAYKGNIPERVFTEPFVPPVINSPADTRTAQRKALKLFREAGYEFKGGKMQDASGTVFTIEFLGNNPTDERITNPFIENLRLLGIEASLRVVDDAQYKSRIDASEFEMTVLQTRQSLSPGNEQREYWSSQAANQPGARNYAGISDPVIDELVEQIILAQDREDLIALTRALDRILSWGFYSIPQWYNPEEWYAWWRKLNFPENQPLYTGLDTWSGWIDTEVEKELGQ